MKCPQCEAEGVTSIVYELGCRTTLISSLPFYDEAGKRHVHDRNRETCEYVCGKGHQFAVNVPHECWCGWKQAEN